MRGSRDERGDRLLAECPCGITRPTDPGLDGSEGRRYDSNKVLESDVEGELQGLLDEGRVVTAVNMMWIAETRFESGNTFDLVRCLILDYIFTILD